MMVMCMCLMNYGLKRHVKIKNRQNGKHDRSARIHTGVHEWVWDESNRWRDKDSDRHLRRRKRRRRRRKGKKRQKINKWIDSYLISCDGNKFGFRKCKRLCWRPWYLRRLGCANDMQSWLIFVHTRQNHLYVCVCVEKRTKTEKRARFLETYYYTSHRSL